MQPVFISCKEAAEVLSLNPRKIQELCNSKYKGFPSILAGNKYLVNTAMLTVWAQRVVEEDGSL